MHQQSNERLERIYQADKCLSNEQSNFASPLTLCIGNAGFAAQKLDSRNFSMPPGISPANTSAFSSASKALDGWTSPLFPRATQNFGQHPSIERALDARRLVERHMPGDGNCLFHAFQDQLAQRGITHFVDITLNPPSMQPIPTTAPALRDLAVRHLYSMKDDYKNFFRKEEFGQFENLIGQASTPNSYSKDIHDYLATSLAKALDVDVVVCQDEHQHSLNPKAAAAGQQTLVITYRSSMNHYNSTAPEPNSMNPSMRSFPGTHHVPVSPIGVKRRAPTISQPPHAQTQAPVKEQPAPQTPFRVDARSQQPGAIERIVSGVITALNSAVSSAVSRISALFANLRSKFF